jgi:hypothetical protein
MAGVLPFSLPEADKQDPGNLALENEAVFVTPHFASIFIAPSIVAACQKTIAERP